MFRFRTKIVLRDVNRRVVPRVLRNEGYAFGASPFKRFRDKQRFKAV